jgi:hypothetical protein
MKVDIRGRCLNGPDGLLIEEQTGAVSANDVEELDDEDEDDTMDAWIPSAREVRTRNSTASESRRTIGSDDGSESDSDDEVMAGTSSTTLPSQEDIDEEIAGDEDDPDRKKTMIAACRRSNRLIAGDVANLKSAKLLLFLANAADDESEEVEEDISMATQTGNAVLLK